MKKNVIFLLLPLIFIFLINCNSHNRQQKPYTFKGLTQGTYYQITYYAIDSIVKYEKIKLLLNNFLKIASLWDSTSEISRVNRNEKFQLSTTFQAIFTQAQEISKITNGAFDVTVGSLVNIWGFGPEKSNEVSQRITDSLKEHIGYQNVEIINNEIVKKYQDIKLDFNAIAKGYSVDLVAEYLRLQQIENFIVDIGGEIYASGLKPDYSKWNIGIEKPTNDKFSEQNIHQVIALSNKAAATSGIYRNYQVKDGVRFSHTINPYTGKPIPNTMLSATVIADCCSIADALATAFMVMDVDNAVDFLKNNKQFDGYFIYYDEQGEIKVVFSEGFKNYFL